jgi:hypothetical protein
MKIAVAIEYFNKTQNNRHSENCKYFHSLRFDYNLNHLEKKNLALNYSQNVKNENVYNFRSVYFLVFIRKCMVSIGHADFWGAVLDFSRGC